MCDEKSPVRAGRLTAPSDGSLQETESKFSDCRVKSQKSENAWVKVHPVQLKMPSPPITITRHDRIPSHLFEERNEAPTASSRAFGSLCGCLCCDFPVLRHWDADCSQPPCPSAALATAALRRSAPSARRRSPGRSAATARQPLARRHGAAVRRSPRSALRSVAVKAPPEAPRNGGPCGSDAFCRYRFYSPNSVLCGSRQP